MATPPRPLPVETPKHQPLERALEGGGRAYQAPQLPSQQQQQQRMPALTNFSQGFVTYTNPPMVGGFGSTAPVPPYYAGGYAQGPTYASFGRLQSQPTLSTGWGNPSLVAPPLRLTHSEPSQRHDEAMDVDDPTPSQRNWARQGCAR